MSTDDRTGAAPSPTGPLSTIDYTERIPNNVNLAERPAAAARAGGLAAEVPRLVEDARARRCRPRTSTCARRSPSAATAGRTSTTCRWRSTAGASSSPSRTPTARVSFGKHKGEPVWQEVPGEHRADLMRLIVVQGDTEPASVEQQRDPRQHRAEPLRPAQPVPGQRRGGPAPLGDGLPAARLLRP